MGNAVGNRASAVVLGSVLLAMTAACGAGAKDGEHGEHGGAAGSGRFKPLSDTQLGRLDRAEQLLIQRCMAGQGLKYWPGREASADELKNVGFVLDDVRWASRHGYGGDLDRKAERERRDDPNSAYLEQLSDTERARWERALFGAQDSRTITVRLPTGNHAGTILGGCTATTREQLYGDLEDWFRASKTAENLVPLYVDDLTQDKRFTGAVDRWSRCMRGKGLPYDSPGKIRDRLPELNERLSPERAHAAEVRLAVAEATCARSSSLADTARSLEREYRDKAIGTKYRAEVDTYLRLQHKAIATANRVIGSRG
jgi:hypothetical protein